MSVLAYAWVLPLLPLAAFVVVIATGRRLPRAVAPALGITTMGIVFAASLAILWSTAHARSSRRMCRGFARSGSRSVSASSPTRSRR